MAIKYIKYLVLSLLIVITCIVALNYIVDPLLYYKRANRAFQTLYSDELRYQIPGLIKNYQDHNTAIVGTSLAGNFLASEVSKQLNSKTVKLTVNGATIVEQSYIVSQYLDAHPNAKAVIWGIDNVYLDYDPERFTIREYKYPFFLYDDSIVNYKYLLNYEVTVQSLQTIANNLLGANFYMKTRDLDTIHTWPTDTPVGCKQVIKNHDELHGKQFKVFDPSLTPSELFNIENAAANMEGIVDIAKKRKDVQFYLFLPPYSIVRYLFEDEYNGLERILKARDLFAEKTRENNNIKIIDLQASEDIIGNLNYYMDMIHHIRKINRLIIDNIVNGNFSDYGSILENTEKLRSMVSRYDLEKIRECVQD